MNGNNRKKIIPTIFVIAGIATALIDSNAAKVFGGMLIGSGLTFLTRLLYSSIRDKGGSAQIRKEPRKPDKPPQTKPGLAASKDPVAMHGQRLGSEYQKKQWTETEIAVDKMLDMFINLAAAHLTNHNTVAVFFPTNNGEYAIRRYISKTGFVNKKAMILPNRGLLGSLITKELQPFYEPGFTNSNSTLFYYDEYHEFEPTENIRSILLSPVMAENDTKGILLADSTKANAYTKSDLDYLANTAKILGQAIYYAYMNTMNSLDHQRLTTITSIEKDFWKDLDFDTVMNKMCETISDAVPCDRLTISLKEEDNMYAKVVRTYGDSAGYFKDLEFAIGDGGPKTLVRLAYSTDLGFFRNFKEDSYEFRYTEDEPQNHGFGSFMVLPIGIDKRIGMILIESKAKNAFARFNLDLLSRLSQSAGIALEKIFIIRKTNDLASHDILTGLFNRQHFQKILTTKIAASKRYEHPISFVMCDIDFFKKFNDNYGHDFGDVVLKGVAAKLNSSVRQEIDAVARWGGEEFVMIIDKSDCNAAKEMADRIRAEIAAMTFKTADGREVKTSMSFGIAEFPKHARDNTELIDNADKALYAAKKNGRNRVEVYWADCSAKFIEKRN
ncbi:MAG: diguanylate cyclase [Chitinispirillales bacterium]|jgi:diguanylate cyclase (GGDEF)-like protein|nr:diguanylate cyclase [Chitinispirillales bacterium]